MQFHSYSEEIDVKVPAERLYWAMFKDDRNCLPKIIPDRIARVEYEVGRFGEVGSVRKIDFLSGVHSFDFMKHKFVEVDDQKLYVKFQVIEGGFKEIYFDNYTVAFQFNEGAVKWTVEYKALTEGKFPVEVKEHICNAVKKIEAFLLANKNEYGTSYA